MMVDLLQMDDGRFAATQLALSCGCVCQWWVSMPQSTGVGASIDLLCSLRLDARGPDCARRPPERWPCGSLRCDFRSVFAVV
jgi:hypothetical protein